MVDHNVTAMPDRLPMFCVHWGILAKACDFQLYSCVPDYRGFYHLVCARPQHSPCRRRLTSETLRAAIPFCTMQMCSEPKRQCTKRTTCALQPVSTAHEIKSAEVAQHKPFLPTYEGSSGQAPAAIRQLLALLQTPYGVQQCTCIKIYPSTHTTCRIVYSQQLAPWPVHCVIMAVCPVVSIGSIQSNARHASHDVCRTS
jgi:hypothetical protein